MSFGDEYEELTLEETDNINDWIPSSEDILEIDREAREIIDKRFNYKKEFPLKIKTIHGLRSAFSYIIGVASLILVASMGMVACNNIPDESRNVVIEYCAGIGIGMFAGSLIVLMMLRILEDTIIGGE